jgi:hypothetical protein
MNRWARFLSLVPAVIAISLLAGPTSANTASLKCNSHHDQIWVYDSLNTFDVEAKLKCGEGVEILERVQDYVKIRAQGGVEGYVPEADFADLPPAAIHPDPTHDVGLVAKQVQEKEIAKAAAADVIPSPAGSGHADASTISGSVTVAPADGTRAKKLPSSGSAAPFTAFAEMNPAPASPAVKETSSSDLAETPVAPPTVAGPSASLRILIADATAARIINRPSYSAAPTGVSDEISDLQPRSDSADLACQKYFSAYGLTPSQMKWIAQNRKRLFSSVCPAPDPSKVDFVIIFTHDVDFFSTTMPEPVHKSNGFSDFTPMTPIDTALVSESEADKARREYVWIFQFAKGTFDPASFSPRREYQFSKMETNSLGSKAGPKAVEDAFRFVAAANH